MEQFNANDRQDRNGLSKKVHSYLSGMPESVADIDIQSLVFRAHVPSKYWHLLVNLPFVNHPFLQSRDDVRKKQDEKEKELRDYFARLLALRQQEIDRNMLKFTINGQDVNISQGELRQAMNERVKSLKERKEHLERTGSDTREIRQIDELLHQYDPLILKLKKEKADAGTTREIQELMNRDPEFAKRLQRQQESKSDQDYTTKRRLTSFAAELDSSSIAGPSLSSIFAKGASPSSGSEPNFAPAAPDRDQQRRNLDRSLQSLGL